MYEGGTSMTFIVFVLILMNLIGIAFIVAGCNMTPNPMWVEFCANFPVLCGVVIIMLIFLIVLKIRWRKKLRSEYKSTRASIDNYKAMRENDHYYY